LLGGGIGMAFLLGSVASPPLLLSSAVGATVVEGILSGWSGRRGKKQLKGGCAESVKKALDLFATCLFRSKIKPDKQSQVDQSSTGSNPRTPKPQDSPYFLRVRLFTS